MEEKLTEILMSKSFSELTEMEKMSYSEWFTTEEDYESLQSLFVQLEEYKKNQPSASYHKTKVALDELFDKFIEIYYGKYSRPTDQIEYTFKAFTYKPDIATTIKDYRDQLLSELSNTLTDQDLDLLNLKDEIEGQFNHLLYLLTLK